MGNRAVITCSKEKPAVGLYLHWNGGPESVLAFLHAAKAFDVRSPACDEAYFLARLAQIIGNFFGGTLSVGLGLVGRLDDFDNGTYVVGGDFEILHRTQAGPKTITELDGKALEKYEHIKASILSRQGPAFDDSDYRTYVQTLRVKEV